ncbi:uncharacterized protein LOC133816954 isoform X2 [Humulus lupulus]|uniref:uncharacterized protein LOC133816954 isoform X2 n=1 Tax=Humulus lupulus TaxID=3486 RepID=UPI002B41439B|nr:uncharacterized protein LOC133816954 isoform X2 [Humulus lupulus]
MSTFMKSTNTATAAAATTTQPATSNERDNHQRTQSQAYDDGTLCCPNGHGTCSLKISHSQRNPDRPYYTCSSCGFFKWASDHHHQDDVGRLKRLRLLPQDYPGCGCGAGKCKLVLGYFVCPIEKGHGACSFRAQATAPGIVNSVLNEGSPVSSEHPKRTKLDSSAVVVVNSSPPDPPSTPASAAAGVGGGPCLERDEHDGDIDVDMPNNQDMGTGEKEQEQEQEQVQELEEVIVDITLQNSCLESDTTQLGQTEILNQISAATSNIRENHQGTTQSQAHDDGTLCCPYGHGTCSLKISHSQSIPNRPYYMCSTCRFFKWASDHHHQDDVSRLKRPRLLPQDYPVCRCGTGKCPIEKGHGACSLHAGAMAPGIVNSLLDEGSQVHFEHPKRTKLDYSTAVVVNNSPPDPPSTPATAAAGVGGRPCLERDEHDGDINVDMSNNQDMGTGEKEQELDGVTVDSTLQVSCLISDTIHRNQTKFLNQISADAGVFPSFDPIYVPKAKGVDAVNSRALNECTRHDDLNGVADTSTQIPSQDSECSGILMELSSIKNVGGGVGERVLDQFMGPISKALGEAALLVQNQLMSILESMNPANHNSMREAANKTFSVLKLLSMDHREFSERVTKFISCTTELAKIEDEWRKKRELMLLPEEIEDWFENEKAKFDEIAEEERETMAAIAASDKRVECIGEEVMRLREKLAGMEKELRHRKMENGELKWRAGMVKENMVAANKKMEEARAAKMVHQERAAAIEALERARFHLRHNH